MIFMREDKMTSSNYMKYELGVSKIKFKILFGNYFQFEVIWVLFKLFFSKNKINGKQGKMIPYSRKFEKNKFEFTWYF